MNLTIKNPELFNIVDKTTKKTSFGGNQSWYQKTWNQKAGCGPTCAANMTAYLAHTRESKKNMYHPESMERIEFLKHMDDLFEYITPGPMGVNKIEKFVDGIKAFAKDREVEIETHALSVDKKTKKSRNQEKIELFLKEAFENDAPIAFLNLSRGDETRLQNWHWITITSVQIWEDTILATASDEGNEIVFNLLLWYMTTNLHGGLIYIV
jgi:hypothetical protein